MMTTKESKKESKESFITDFRVNQPTRLLCRVKTQNRAWMNALRRTLYQVRHMAIDASDVEVLANTSISHNPELIFRLSLVTFQNSGYEKKFTEFGVCPCENRKCNKCSVEVSLNVTNPPNVVEPTKTRVVTVADLVSASKEIIPIQNGMELTTLLPGHELKLKAWVRKGPNHTSFKSVAIATFHAAAKITLDEKQVNKLSEEKKQLFVQADPDDVFAYDPTTNTLAAKHPENCRYSTACVQLADQWDMHGLVKIEEDEQNQGFWLKVETVGSLTAKECLDAACEKLQSDLERIISDF